MARCFFAVNKPPDTILLMEEKFVILSRDAHLRLYGPEREVVW